MTILYRALWNADVPDGAEKALEGLKHGVAAWSQESKDPTPLSPESTQIEVSQNRRRTVGYRAVENGFEVLVTDEVPGGPAKWTVKIQALVDNEVHVRVENEMESDDLTQRIAVGRPLVVHELLSAATGPRLGHSAILSEPQSIPAPCIEILIDHLADPERMLPVIVCSEPGGQPDDQWLRVAERVARRVEGIAAVITLDRASATAFKDRFGSLAIWNGGVRVYAPQPVTTDSDGWHHRYYLGSLFETSQLSTINRIVYSVSQLSTRRRVPAAFAAFDERPAQSASSGDMVPATEHLALIDENLLEIEKLRDAHDHELATSRDEQGSLQVELASATGHLARLKEELISRGLADVIWGTLHEDPTSVPDQVQDLSEAVLAAQTYLGQWLALPDSAIRELEDLDNSPNGFAWGNTTWRGLRALAAYAQDRAQGWNGGGFWEWCASGPLLGWPATPKKLSMTESDFVQNTTKLANSRVFDVDERVDASGRITMLAHLKIAEGGGPLAPRVYFHDDTAGATGMVHVGLVGPHSLVPNKGTN